MGFEDEHTRWTMFYLRGDIELRRSLSSNCSLKPSESVSAKNEICITRSGHPGRGRRIAEWRFDPSPP